MKIYCSKKYNSDEEFIHSNLLGKPYWILARYNNPNEPSYFQVISEDDDCYRCRYFSQYWLEQIFEGRDLWDEEEIRDTATNVYDFYKPSLILVEPYEILPDEEVFGEWFDTFQLYKSYRG